MRRDDSIKFFDGSECFTYHNLLRGFLNAMVFQPVVFRNSPPAQSASLPLLYGAHMTRDARAVAKILSRSTVMHVMAQLSVL